MEKPDALAEVTTKLNEVHERVAAAATRLEALEATPEGKASSEDVEALQTDIAGFREQIGVLTKEREDALREAEFKAMQSKMTDLQSVIADLRKPGASFTFSADESDGKAISDVDRDYETGKRSIFKDIQRANKGDAEARARLTEGIEGDLTPEGKAMTEGVDAQGGYLVRPLIERQLVEAKELDNVLRGICSKINVTTNGIQLDQLGLSTVAGWVAELAQKPESTGMTIASITASVFTAAGLATISNQLLADSNPSVDALVVADLRKRLVALEETAFLNGSGVNQPLGILQTPGLSATPITTNTVAEVLNKILLAIADVETNHGAPSHILMHPRTWTQIITSKDADGAWVINPAAPGQSAVTGARTINRGPDKILFGYNVLTSNRIPTNLGSGTNESRIIVGDFSEALILDRQGVTVDESSHVYFTTNQTVFRAEERVGFTAARTPQAFNIIGGAGLANL